MNPDTIIHNERENDGTCIHLYFDGEDAATWTAYGISAYALRLFTKDNGYDSRIDFSEALQMPCTSIGAETCKLLNRQEDSILRMTDSHISIRIPDTIDTEAYHQWTNKLRCKPKGGDKIAVRTPVSSEVPKDQFIADNMSALARNFKRFSDLLLSGLALVVFSPLILICYIAVKREDNGPAIFKQERIGRFGRPFYIYKFRSMRLDAEKFGPQLSRGRGDDDPRLTKVGRFLRMHHLDELPQLWNVFCGDMAFVGPRPERKFYIDQIIEHDPRYIYLYQIRPGVTSYATLYNGYTDTMEKMLQRLEYDLYYLSHRSWWLDFTILFKTFCAIVFGKRF